MNLHMVLDNIIASCRCNSVAVTAPFCVKIVNAVSVIIFTDDVAVPAF